MTSSIREFRPPRLFESSRARFAMLLLLASPAIGACVTLYHVGFCAPPNPYQGLPPLDCDPGDPLGCQPYQHPAFIYEAGAINGCQTPHCAEQGQRLCKRADVQARVRLYECVPGTCSVQPSGDWIYLNPPCISRDLDGPNCWGPCP